MKLITIRFVLILMITISTVVSIAWAEDTASVDSIVTDVQNNRNTSSNNQSRIQGLEIRVSDLESSAGDFQAQIDAEEAARIAADVLLQQGIDDEVAVRDAQIQQLSDLVATLQTTLANLQTRLTTAEAAIASQQSQISDLSVDLTAAQNLISTNATAIGSNTTAITDLEMDLEEQQLLTSYMSVNPVTHEVFFTGANVYIQSGSGATDGPINGLGNLIIGYNEMRGGDADIRSGSHNVVVGSENNFSSFGGLVVGDRVDQKGAVTIHSNSNINVSGLNINLFSSAAMNLDALQMNLDSLGPMALSALLISLN